jgi:integrase/recombinase XerD
METMEQEKLMFIRYAQEDESTLRDKGVSLVAFLDTFRPRADGLFMIRLRIIYNRQPKYFSTKITSSIKDYKIITDYSKNPRGDLGRKRKKIQEKLEEAHSAIKSLDDFSWHEFKKKYQRKGTNFNSVWEAFEGHISDLKKRKRYGTADTYISAQNSLKQYHAHNKKIQLKREVAIRENGRTVMIAKNMLKESEFWKVNSKVLHFKQIDVQWLNEYQKWMEENSRTKTTISIYVRCLRNLFNLGLKDGLREIDYPFGAEKDEKYQPPEHNNTKRALSLEEIEKLYNFQSENEAYIKYRDLFIFSYISHGINLTDVCRLSYNDIDNKYIELIRKKTASRKKTFTIRILLTEEHKRIIDKYGTGEHYIFDIINTGMDEQTKRQAIKQFTHNMNDNLKRIAKIIDIDDKISSMFARHSFASIARDAKIPESTISQCMGHSRGFGVTGQYFDVPDKALQDVAHALLSFKYDKELTGIEKVIFEKLKGKEQELFKALSPDQREQYVLTYLAKKL